MSCQCNHIGNILRILGTPDSNMLRGVGKEIYLAPQIFPPLLEKQRAIIVLSCVGTPCLQGARKQALAAALCVLVWNSPMGCVCGCPRSYCVLLHDHKQLVDLSCWPLMLASLVGLSCWPLLLTSLVDLPLH